MKATEMINQLQELINEYGDCAVSQKEFDEYDQNYKHKYISKIIADYNNNLIPEFYTVSESKTYIPKCCNNPNWKRKEYDYISVIKQAIIDKGYIVSKYFPENRTLRVIYKDIYLSVYVGIEYKKFGYNLQEHIQKLITLIAMEYEDKLQRNKHAIRSNLEMR